MLTAYLVQSSMYVGIAHHQVKNKHLWDSRLQMYRPSRLQMYRPM